MFVCGNPVSFMDVSGYSDGDEDGDGDSDDGSGSSSIFDSICNFFGNAWDNLSDGNNKKETKIPTQYTETTNDFDNQYLHQSSRELYQFNDESHGVIDGKRDGIEIELDDELKKAYDLIDDDKKTGLSEETIVNAGETACVAISLYRALRLSGAEVGSFGDFYADNVNNGLIQADNSYVRNKVKIAKNYGKELVQINNPTRKNITTYLRVSSIKNGVIRRNGHNFNVYWDNRTSNVYVADEGNWGRTGKTLKNAIGNSSIQYFYFIKEPYNGGN